MSGRNQTEASIANPHPPSPCGLGPPSPALRRAVRGKYPCNVNLCGTPRNRVEVVLRGLDPRIHVFVSTVSRRGWPGQAPPTRNMQGDFLPLPPPEFFPGSPAPSRGRVGVGGPARRTPLRAL